MLVYRYRSQGTRFKFQPGYVNEILSGVYSVSTGNYVDINLNTQLLQSLMQLFVHQFYTSTTISTSVFTLVQHVSATLGHHQALLLSLLKLSRCNLAFIYAHLFICLMLCFTFVFL
jgi:hypothetical protein